MSSGHVLALGISYKFTNEPSATEKQEKTSQAVGAGTSFISSVRNGVRILWNFTARPFMGEPRKNEDGPGSGDFLLSSCLFFQVLWFWTHNVAIKIIVIKVIDKKRVEIQRLKIKRTVRVIQERMKFCEFSLVPWFGGSTIEKSITNSSGSVWVHPNPLKTITKHISQGLRPLPPAPLLATPTCHLGGLLPPF